MIIQICVGSSCHLKGAPEIVSWLQNEVEQRRLDADVTLAGSFCVGKCNRVGVTVRVDDEIYPGITPEALPRFFEDHVLSVLEGGV